MQFDYHTVLTLPIVGVGLKAYLAVPEGAYGIVIFSFGSGLHDLADYQHEETALLHKHQLGTLVFDPLTEKESRNYANRFNIDLLADRLITVTKWLLDHKSVKGRSIGYFGAGAGAAAALVAAACIPVVSAVVCRDGKLKPDESEITALRTPTLFIAGELDEPSLEVQQQLYDIVTCKKQLTIIQGAGNKWDKEDKNEEMRLATLHWFSTYLAHPHGKKHRH